jgi:hypothetical protein
VKNLRETQSRRREAGLRLKVSNLQQSFDLKEWKNCGSFEEDLLVLVLVLVLMLLLLLHGPSKRHMVSGQI